MRLLKLLNVGLLLAIVTVAQASAATLTFKFYSGGQGAVDTMTATGADTCADGDVCAQELTLTKSGLSVTATATRGGDVAEVIQDLVPDWGGLGVNGDPVEDNIAGNEVLSLAFSRPVRLVQQVSFRNHFASWPNQNNLIVTRNGGADQVFPTPGGDADGLTRVTFNYDPDFWGTSFTYRIEGQDSFYVSELIVETVPEPGLLLLLGTGLVGLAGTARRRLRR